MTDLFGEIDAFLNAAAPSSAEEIRVEEFILLALLAKRGVTTRQATIDLAPADRDRLRLVRYLVTPGLAPGLAGATLVGETIRVAPDWAKIAGYFGKSLNEFGDILEHRVPKTLGRNWPTVAYLLSRDTGGRADDR